MHKYFISERDSRLMMGNYTLEKKEKSNPIKGGIQKSLTIQSDILLQEGDRIGSLKALHVPGHTPGLMAYRDVRNQAIIVGDAFSTKGDLQIAGHLNPIFPFPALATWDLERAVLSAEKTLNLKH